MVHHLAECLRKSYQSLRWFRPRNISQEDRSSRRHQTAHHLSNENLSPHSKSKFLAVSQNKGVTDAARKQRLSIRCHHDSLWNLFKPYLKVYHFVYHSPTFTKGKPSNSLRRRALKYGGPGGIRTLDTLLTYTPLAGERFQPLSHRSGARLNGRDMNTSIDLRQW